MKKQLIFISTFITLLVSCQKESKSYKDNNNFENNISMNDETDVLKKQLRKGLKATIGDAIDYQIEYTNEDVKIEDEILKNILKQQGFKFLSNDEFKNRIIQIYQRELDYSSSKEYLYINILNPCKRDVVFFKNNILDYNGFFVYKINHFIADLYAIPELIEYQKKYHGITEYESNLPYNYIEEGSEIKIHKWMNESDLSQLRQKNIETLVARNKYLFNDSKADFVWLKFNDVVFLESLVKTFGYVKDKDLLAFVLKNNVQKPEELGRIIWNVKCDGKVVFNDEVMKYISTLPQQEETQYLKSIKEYISSLVDHKNKFLNENFSKKAEIIGKLAYYSEKIGEKVDMQFNFFKIIGTTEDAKKYEAEFKKQNYYNIPDFKEIWDDTKNGGVWFPGMEEASLNFRKGDIISPLQLYDRADFSSFSREIIAKGEIEYLNKTADWNYIKVNDTVGYIPTEEQKEKLATTEKRKHSFLADEKPEIKKKKGFWDSLFG